MSRLKRKEMAVDKIVWLLRKGDGCREQEMAVRKRRWL
jgi:hypothetical protein